MNVKQVKKLTDFRWVNLFEANYEDKSGVERFWTFASRHPDPKNKPENADAVIIIPLVKDVDAKYKIVMTKEYRVPIMDFEWGFPAGLIDKGENFAQAAKRELREETGLDLVRVLGSSPLTYSSAGITDESIQYVFVEASGTISNKGNESTENIEVFMFDTDGIQALMKDKSTKMASRAWAILLGALLTKQLFVPLK